MTTITIDSSHLFFVMGCIAHAALLAVLVLCCDANGNLRAR